MRAKIQGVVSMEGVVTANGTVGDVRITKSLDDQLGLDQQAIRAVKQWRFHPARDADGTPVAVVVTFHMEFQLK
jgi:TonB family protein